MTPGSLFAHFLPLRLNGVLFGVYDYLLPIVLYCSWSSLVLIDLARSEPERRSRAVGWSAAVLAFPAVGAAAYLLFGRSTLSRVVRLGAVWGGVALVAAAYAYSLVRVR